MQQQVKKIGTHNGSFHADEVLACIMLTKFTKEFQNGQITRTRDEQVLKVQDIVVDVGGTYEPESLRFDHHQRTFQDTLNEERKIRLSSAGLVYKHYGKEIIQNIMIKLIQENECIIQIDTSNEEILDLIYMRIYKQFIESVDGIDNGVNQYSEGQSNYNETTHYSQRVSRLNPIWSLQNQPKEDQAFQNAMLIAEEELVSQVKAALFHWYPARPYVERAIEKRFDVDKSGKIIVLETYVPWASHLNSLEEKLNIQGDIKFVMFEEQSKRGWRLQGINLKDSYELRLGIKKEWRGIKDMEELIRVSQIPDIVFVHMSGFIGGSRSYESTLKMAQVSLQDDIEQCKERIETE